MTGHQFIRVRMAIEPDRLEAIQAFLLESGHDVRRHPYEGEGVGGFTEWQENLTLILALVEAPGAVWATVELVRQKLGAFQEDVLAINVSVDDTTGKGIFLCASCETHFYIGQTEHVPALCPDVRCPGRGLKQIGWVGNNDVFSDDVPFGLEVEDRTRRLFISPPCPVCGSATEVEWRPVDEAPIGSRWMAIGLWCSAKTSH